MEVIKVRSGKIDSWAVVLALKYLRQGKTIIYPTETFYGLGCDATNSRAVAKIYLIKGRRKQKALPFLLADFKMAKDWLVFSRLALTLAKRYWPGPLSLVLPLTEKGGKNFRRADAGARISSHPFAATLVKKLGQPLISTSANLSAHPASRSAAEAIKYFKNRKYRPDLIIDAGRLPKSLGSTFVDLTGAKPIILREGDIKIKNLKSKI